MRTLRKSLKQWLESRVISPLPGRRNFAMPKTMHGLQEERSLEIRLGYAYKVHFACLQSIHTQVTQRSVFLPILFLASCFPNCWSVNYSFPCRLASYGAWQLRWAQLLITSRTAAYPTRRRSKYDEGWASGSKRQNSVDER